MSPRPVVPGPWRLHPPSQALQGAPTTAWARHHVPPAWCARALETAAPLAVPSRRTDHRLDRDPCPPRLVCPGLEDCSPLQAPHDAPTIAWAGPHVPPGRCARALETAAPLRRRSGKHKLAPGQDSLSPQAGVPGPWSKQPPLAGPLGRTDHCLGRTPCPPRPVCPGLGDCSPLAGPSGRTNHRLCRIACPPKLVCPDLDDYQPPRRPFGTHRPPPRQDPLSPQTGVPATWRPWRKQPPLARPLGRTDHRLGRTPCPPQLVCPGLGDCIPPSQALPDATTTAWTETPVPPGWCARALEAAAPLCMPFRTHGPPLGQDPLSPQAGVPGHWRLQPLIGPSWHTDHRQGRTPCPNRLVCPGLGASSPPSRGLQDAPTTAWARLPIPPSWCARALKSAAPLAGPSGRSDHRLGRTPCPPRLVCPGLGDCSPPSQALQDAPTTAWTGPPFP